jgi:hypothetical protein
MRAASSEEITLARVVHPGLSAARRTKVGQELVAGPAGFVTFLPTTRTAMDSDDMGHFGVSRNHIQRSDDACVCRSRAEVLLDNVKSGRGNHRAVRRKKP